MSAARHMLVTAFEPSGDAVAAPLVAELKRRDPALVVHALGGARLQAAGAELLETTTEGAIMGLPPVRKVIEHRARMQRLREWMKRNGGDLAAVIPTDSPAANWAVCEMTRELRREARIIHLVAPQLWAWGAWRIRKMRRLSDHALCLLPFEVGWFEERGVPASFVGHPVFERVAGEADGETARGVEATRLVVLPGSRPGELRANWPTMRGAIERLRADRRLEVRVALRDERDAEHLEPSLDGAEVVAAATDEALRWCDAALAASGTVTLQVAAHRKPMVILYNVSRLTWNLLGRWIIATRTFTLPNLIGEHLGMGRRVPELVPHFGEVEPVVELLRPLLEGGDARQRQRELFDRIHEAYARVRFHDAAANVVERELDRR